MIDLKTVDQLKQAPIEERLQIIELILHCLLLFSSRKKVFDVALAATLNDNEILGLYTVNINDFDEFDFLEVIDLLESETGNLSSCN